MFELRGNSFDIKDPNTFFNDQPRGKEGSRKRKRLPHCLLQAAASGLRRHSHKPWETHPTRRTHRLRRYPCHHAWNASDPAVSKALLSGACCRLWREVVASPCATMDRSGYPIPTRVLRTTAVPSAFGGKSLHIFTLLRWKTQVT